MSSVGVQRPALWEADTAVPAGEHAEPFWRSLFYFTVYRLLVALLLLMSVAIWGTALWLGSRDLTLFVVASVVYLISGVAVRAHSTAQALN